MQKSEIIDIHCHTAGIGAGGSGCSLSPSIMKSWKLHFYLKAFGVTKSEVLKHGDGLIIERISKKLAMSQYVGSAIVLAMDGVIGADGELDLAKTEMYVPNDFLAKEIRKYDNLHFGASINPYRKDAIACLHKAAEENACLIKWLPNIQLIDPADKRITEFYMQMKQLGLPLLTHTGHEYSFTRSRNKLGDPGRLRLPLEAGVTVIAAHAATMGRNNGTKNFDRLLPLFEEYENLYADISSLTQINKLGHLRKVLEHKDIHEKLLYGTDMPLLETGIVSPYFFVHNIGLLKSIEIGKLRNPWDRDVGLKMAMGVPESVFIKAKKVIRC